MKIALRFIRPELDSIRTFVDAALAIKAKAEYCTFTIVLPKSVLPAVANTIRDVGILSTQDVLESKTKFDKFIECTGVLSEVDKSKAFDRAQEYIKQCANLLQISDAIHRVADFNSVNRIVIQGTHDPCDGYGASTENIIIELAKLTNVTFVPRTSGASAGLSHPAVKNAILGNKNSLSYLYYMSPQPETLNDGIKKPLQAKRFLMTMFETNQVPLAWPGRINNYYDKLIVPCEFNKKHFELGGIRVPIEVIKLGVRTDIYTYKPRQIYSSRPYRFLFLFANHGLHDDRKNGPLVLQTFNKLFRGRKDVELIVKISGEVPRDLEKYFSDNVKIINNRISVDEVAKLYHSADCFLFPSRGEGYGMPPREAMATGMPVILTNFSALEDIALPHMSYPINVNRLVDAHYNFDKWLASTHNNNSYHYGKWADVNIDELAEQMLYVFNHQEDGILRGRAAAHHIHQHETVQQTANAILNSFRT